MKIGIVFGNHRAQQQQKRNDAIAVLRWRGSSVFIRALIEAAKQNGAALLC